MTDYSILNNEFDVDDTIFSLSPNETTGDGNEFAPFKSFDMIVTFNKLKLTYTAQEQLWAHFSVSASNFKMKDDDRVGICQLPDNELLVSKSIAECEIDNEIENLDDIGLLDEDKLIAKKTCFNQSDLPSPTSKMTVYFQFCYQNATGSVLGKSTPFKISNRSEMSPKLADNTINQENISELQKDDFIVVRSQESFLKERIEHLTKSNCLLQYLIRNIEEDLISKANEASKLKSELDDCKNQLSETLKAKNEAIETLKFANLRNIDLDNSKEKLQNALQKEQEIKDCLEQELFKIKNSQRDYEEDLKKSQEIVEKLQASLSKKEMEASSLQNLVVNLQSNNELSKKVTKLEDELEDIRGNLAKTLDERRSLLEERSNWKSSQKSFDKIKNDLIQRTEELELVKEKQMKEIKTLEDELKQTISNLKNLNSKYENEQVINMKKQQELVLKNDKLNVDYIEMRARLEQAKIEYGNLYVKYRNQQKKYQSLKNTSSLYSSLSEATFTSVENSNTSYNVNSIDQALQDLEHQENQKQPSNSVENVSITNVNANAPPLVDESNHDDVNEAIIEPTESDSQVQILVKTISTENDQDLKSNIVEIPCIMCEKVIKCRQHEDGSGQMDEMIDHFETVHKQKMCPICSILFDSRLPIFQTSFINHIQNHVSQMKYPK